MKRLTYNSLNLKKWLSNSTIEVNLYCFYLQEYLSFDHFKKNECIILFFINIPI